MNQMQKRSLQFNLKPLSKKENNHMEAFRNDIEFCYPWRSYQQRR